MPGIEVNSPLFLKAVSLVAKQQDSLTASSSSNSDYSAGAPSKGKGKHTPAGSSFWIIILILADIIPFSYHLLDPISKLLNGLEGEIITHARDVVANSIMAEIANEDPHGLDEYKDAIRHQIVATYQRLRLLVLILDHLVATYNSAK